MKKRASKAAKEKREKLDYLRGINPEFNPFVAEAIFEVTEHPTGLFRRNLDGSMIEVIQKREKVPPIYERRNREYCRKKQALSRGGIWLWEEIKMAMLKTNTVILDKHLLARKADCTHRKIELAIKELCESGFISLMDEKRSKTGVSSYWVNPMFITISRVVNLYPGRIVVKTKEE